MLTHFEEIMVLLTFTSVVIIPMCILIARSAAKVSRIEITLIEIAKDVNDNARAANSRIRWLEENLWKGHARNAVRGPQER